ncbi:hypothetical protein ACFFV7_40915 [Nonomuraea spiralis]|uniref:Uncharacterized protein n=1 Tax=Nonomuraea spiralis TaxID=46182 RepID=A0ABV5ISR8_9ACTN|nr:hypothetical protein [Nonomuraea spiralis]
MTIETTGGLLIAVALRDDLRRDPQRYWPRRDDELRRRRKRVEWLFGPHVTLARQMIKRTGYAFTVTCRNDGLHRTVQVGLKEGGKIPVWVDLTDCKIDDKGHLWTPPLAEMLRRRAPRSKEPVEQSPPPAVKEQPRTVARITGFPLSVNLLTVLPRAADGQTIEADITCPVAELPTEVVQVKLPDVVRGLSVGRPYQVVGPALSIAESRPDSNDLTWTIHAQALSPLFLDESETEAVEERLPKLPDWNKVMAMLVKLKQARISSDDRTSARLRAEIERLIPQLTQRQQIQARKQLDMDTEVRGPKVAPESAKKRRTSVSQARAAKRAKAAEEVHRNQASILFEMIKRAESQGRRREAKALYEVLRRFLDGLPADEYREQRDRLARCRRHLSSTAARRLNGL